MTALPESPFSLSPQTSNFFRSTAPLSNIRKVQVRRRNGRCLGMYLSYADSTVETLGQWDPTDRDSILKIYGAIDGVLITLVFHTRLADECLRKPQIERISAEVTANTSQPWVPEDAASDYANSCDSEVSFCGSCGSSKCCDSQLRRKTLVKAFRCSQPGQVSKRPLQLLFTTLLT